MIVNHIHQALAQVRELRLRVIERQRFTGYSGRARIISGLLAMGAAALLASAALPDTDTTRVMVWGALCLTALILNYGALLYWFLYDEDVARDWRKLRPTLDVLPPLAIGACLTLALLLRGECDLLFGVWMLLFGLANLASRHVLPRPIALVGLYYMACGVLCLFLPSVTFGNPWPMGVVFCAGEIAGGAILHVDQTRRVQ